MSEQRHIHTYIHTYIHAYMHTYIHTYIAREGGGGSDREILDREVKGVVNEGILKNGRKWP